MGIKMGIGLGIGIRMGIGTMDKDNGHWDRNRREWDNEIHPISNAIGGKYIYNLLNLISKR